MYSMDTYTQSFRLKLFSQLHLYLAVFIYFNVSFLSISEISQGSVN